MLDYLALQGSTENPTFVTTLFTILLTFLLSSLIAFTYQKTTRQIIAPIEFLQSLILVSIVSATVMQAIGDSLARGLGMLGAMAIIRFRTTLRTPRNMVFTFAALAVGISCGVFGFVIAVTGTIGFCLTAFLLRLSPMSKMAKLTGILKFDLPVSSEELEHLETVLDSFCRKYVQVRYRLGGGGKEKDGKASTPTSEKMISYEYHLKLNDPTQGILLDEAIMELQTIQSVKLNFENLPENV